MDTHAMLAIQATEEQVEEHAKGLVYELPANNGRREVCISGTVEEINNIRGHLEASGFQSL
jgi:hypothetical protein